MRATGGGHFLVNNGLLEIPGGTPLKKLRGCSSYLLGGKICELVPLTVVKPKMTPARVVVVPFWGL